MVEQHSQISSATLCNIHGHPKPAGQAVHSHEKAAGGADNDRNPVCVRALASSLTGYDAVYQDTDAGKLQTICYGSKLPPRSADKGSTSTTKLQASVN